MSHRIKPKEKYVRISMKEIWRNLDGPPKNKELWIYVVKFEFSRPKSRSIYHKSTTLLTSPDQAWCESLQNVCVCAYIYIYI